MARKDGERLRQLVGDYGQGSISKQSYRKQRAELLDNIGAQVEEQSTTVTRPDKSPAEEDLPVAGSGAKHLATQTSGFAPKKGLTIAAAIAGIAAVAYLVVTQVFEFSTERVPGAAQDEAVRDNGTGAGEVLITEFLSENDWSEDSLNDLSRAWEALDDGQRELAKEGRRYRRFATTLHQRIREEIALGNVMGSGRLDLLTGFATTMGAPYKEYRDPPVNESPQPETRVRADRQDEPPNTGSRGDNSATDPIDTSGRTPESRVADMPLPEDADLPDEEAEAMIEEVEEPADEIPRDPDTTTTDTAGPATVIEDPCPAAIANTRRPYCRDLFVDGGKGPAMVVLPTGSFDMGSEGVETESPVHRVDIGHNIAMSRFEITADEYTDFCIATGSSCADLPWNGDYPVVSVTWDDAVSYTEWLSSSTGFQYRLPTEAEWEFAARAGTQSPYYFGDEITPSAALSSENGPVDAPVPLTDRTINRNPFRLYHMSGNVREWTLDAWYPNYENSARDGSARLSETVDSRVVRGGSFSDPGSKLRCAAREPLDRSHSDTMTGFRVVREIVPQAADK